MYVLNLVREITNLHNLLSTTLRKNRIKRQVKLERINEALLFGISKAKGALIQIKTILQLLQLLPSISLVSTDFTTVSRFKKKSKIIQGKILTTKDT